jgi:hypothetical protein
MITGPLSKDKDAVYGGADGNGSITSPSISARTWFLLRLLCQVTWHDQGAGSIDLKLTRFLDVGAYALPAGRIILHTRDSARVSRHVPTRSGLMGMTIKRRGASLVSVVAPVWLIRILDPRVGIDIGPWSSSPSSFPNDGGAGSLHPLTNVGSYPLHHSSLRRQLGAEDTKGRRRAAAQSPRAGNGGHSHQHEDKHRITCHTVISPLNESWRLKLAEPVHLGNDPTRTLSLTSTRPPTLRLRAACACLDRITKLTDQWRGLIAK